MPHRSPRLCSSLFILFPPYCLDWIVFVDLPSSSLILYFTTSKLLWAPLFFIFNTRISIWFFLKHNFCLLILSVWWYSILMLAFNSLGMLSSSPLIIFITDAISWFSTTSVLPHRVFNQKEDNSENSYWLLSPLCTSHSFLFLCTSHTFLLKVDV